jgi:hypothetical protein
MESPVFESQGVKRKRTPQDDGARPTPPHVTATAGGGPSGNSINYLIKLKPDKLRLIEVDSDSFSGILGIIDDYEGTSIALLLAKHMLSSIWDVYEFQTDIFRRFAASRELSSQPRGETCWAAAFQDSREALRWPHQSK